MIMDSASIVTIIIVVVIAYFFFKLVISPIIRAVFGILAFLIVIYFLQRVLNFNVDQLLAQAGIHSNINGWISNLSWLLGPINNYLEQIKNFFLSLWQKFPKSPKL